jgi:hypothetical protein
MNQLYLKYHLSQQQLCLKYLMNLKYQMNHLIPGCHLNLKYLMSQQYLGHQLRLKYLMSQQYH